MNQLPHVNPLSPELKRRIKDEPGFAKSLLRDAGIINENGTLAERFGGKA